MDIFLHRVILTPKLPLRNGYRVVIIRGNRKTAADLSPWPFQIPRRVRVRHFFTLPVSCRDTLIPAPVWAGAGFDNHSTKIRHNILFPLSRRPPICGAPQKIFPDPANRRAAFLGFPHFLHRDDSSFRANPRRIGIICNTTPVSRFSAIFSCIIVTKEL